MKTVAERIHSERGARPLIMGILNVTPDSFSDGGEYAEPDAALAHALAMIEAGADVIDVGGESTRPGAQRESDERQLARVIPVLERLHRQSGERTLISVDTTRSAVAAAAIKAGAGMINDISAGRESADMFALAARSNVPIVLMHMRGEPATMNDAPRYDDVVEEVLAFLQARAAAAKQAGVDARRIVLDPGIGFGKRREDNLALLRALPRLVALGHPVLLGASRKRFMGSLLQVDEPRDLLGASCASTALAVTAGVRMFRVHDVAANRQAADVAWWLTQDQR